MAARRCSPPIPLGGLSLPNRIIVSPMCQYSAEAGVANDWHLMHLGGLALGGAGLLMLEATAVEPRGRITPGCLGLYDDATEQALARVMTALRRWGTTLAIGIQIAHAGRKASAHVPWHGGRALGADDGAWATVAPSALPFGPDWPVPEALDADGLEQIKAQFVATAERALRLGFDVVELHGAHGYLLHEFLSPLSNHRDGWLWRISAERGASASRSKWSPKRCAPSGRRDRVLGIRVSAIDWTSDAGLSHRRHRWPSCKANSRRSASTMSAPRAIRN